MKRAASISIKNRDLLNVLKKYASVQDSHKICEAIIEFSLLNPVNRFMITTNKTNRNKLVRSISIHVEEFNRILNSVRIKNNHKFSRLIMKTDKEYLMLCDVANDAEEFCSLFELSNSSGFIEYCQIGLDKIGKNYSLNKFKSYKTKIFETKEKMQVISSDKTPKITRDFSSYHLEKCNITRAEIRKKVFATFHHDFIYAKNQADECQAIHTQWIDAQYDGLKYLDIVPEAYQLHGVEAEKRYYSYLKKGVGDWRVDAMLKMKQADKVHTP